VRGAHGMGTRHGNAERTVRTGCVVVDQKSDRGGELISAGMTQHVRVNSKGELRRSAGSLARRGVVPRKNYWKFLEAPHKS
jgi:hypothetical protein